MQSFLAKHQITQVTHSAPLQSTFGALGLLAFPKTKITWKGKRFQATSEIQDNAMLPEMMCATSGWRDFALYASHVVSSSWVICTKTLGLQEGRRLGP